MFTAFKVILIIQVIGYSRAQWCITLPSIPLSQFVPLGTYSSAIISADNSICSDECLTIGNKYSGIWKNLYCFCTNDLGFASNITNTTACVGSDGILMNLATFSDLSAAYEILPDIFQSVVGPSNRTMTPTVYTVNPLGGNFGWKYSYMDRGDAWEYNSNTSTIRRIITFPGVYQIYAQIVKLTNQFKISQSNTEFVVYQNIVNMNLTCQPLGIIYTLINCTLTMTSGSSMTGTISANGAVVENIAIPDFKLERVGPVPNYFSNDFITANSINTINIVGKMFQYTGTVSYIELNVGTLGSITLLLLKPNCPLFYCPANAACSTNATCSRQLSCSEYCPMSISCSNVCNSRLLNAENVTTLPVNYIVVNSFTYSPTQSGYQIISPPIPWPVGPGFRIAFKSSSTTIATTVVRNGEITDFSGGNLGTANSTSITSFTPLNFVHQISAVSVPQRNIKFKLMFNTTGLRTITVSLQTLDNTAVTATSQTLIGLNINDTSFFYPGFAATNVSYQFLLNPLTGDQLQYYWNFGDNTTSNTTGQVTNHTYTTSGIYNASVIVFNSVVSRFQYFIVNVKDAVKINYFNGTIATNANSFVNFLLAMTSGTGFNCTMSGDGFSNMTQPSSNLTFMVQWPNEGTYNVRMDCRNEISYDFRNLTQIIMNNISGLAFTVLGGEALQPTQIQFIWQTGSNITFSLMIDNITYPTTKDEVLKVGQGSNITVSRVGIIIGVLRATNLISDLILVANLSFFQRITGVQIIPDKVFVNNGSAITFYINMTSGSGVQAFIDYADGNNATLQVPLTSVWMNNFTVYTFKNIGTYNVSVNCSNLANSQQAWVVVYVITSLGSYSATANKYFLQQSDTVQVTLNRTSGSPALMANITINWQDNTFTTVTYQNFNESAIYPHQYSSNGIYNVTILLQNPINSVFKTIIITIMNPIVNLRCVNVPPNTWTGNSMFLQAFADSGDNVLLTLIPGDGNSNLTKALNITAVNTMHQFSYTYNTVNNFTATVMGCNQLGCLNCSTVIVIQYRVIGTNFQLTTNGNIELYKNNSIATLTFSGTNFPTLMQATYTYSDGSTPSVVSIPQASMPYNFSKNLSADGPGNLLVKLENLVSSANLTATYGAFLKFVNFNVGITWGSTRALGFGPANNIFPFNQPLFFRPASTSVGTVTGYIFLFVPLKSPNNVFQCNATLTNGEFNYTFTQMGDFNVSFKAYNPIDSAYINKVVTIGSSIQDTQISTNPATLKPKIFGYVYITWSVISTDSCICINLGNGTKKVYGATAGCNNCTNYVYTNIKPVNNRLTLLGYYPQEGDYNIIVFIYNAYESVTVNRTIGVTSQPCAPPVVSMTYPDFMNVNTPQTEMRSTQIVLSAVIIDIPCVKTKNNFKLWSATRIDPLYMTPLQTVNLSSIPTSNNTQLIIPPRFLDYGVYKFVFTVVMDKNLTIFTFQSSNFTYLKVVKSPIIVGLSSGGITLIVKGVQENICFFPLLYSFDPDLNVQNFSNWTWTWTCQQPNETMSTSITVYPKPIGFIFTSPKTGCFGDGPGTVNFSSSPCFPGSNLDINKTYTFVLVGVAPDQRNGSATISLQAVDGIPPNITVRCLRPLMCRINYDGPYAFNEVVFNPSDSLLLAASCVQANLSLCNQGIWTIEILDNSTNKWSPLSAALTKTYIKGYDSLQTAVDSSFFSVFINVSRLRICYSSVGLTANGKACIQFYVFPLPKNVNCRLSKLSVLQTEPACVECNYVANHQYRMYVNASGIFTTLGFTSSGNFCSIIPYQTINQTYLVRITNSNGGFIDVDAGTIMVKELSTTDMSKILSAISNGTDANLTLIIAKGDFKEMSQSYLQYISVISVSNKLAMEGFFGPLTNNSKTSLGGTGYLATNIIPGAMTVDQLPQNVRDKYEDDRDKKSAIVNIMSAGLYSMVPADVPGLHLISSVVSAMTGSMDCINRVSQWQLSEKIKSLANTFKDLQQTATKDDLQAIGTNLLTANLESDAAANIQIDNGIKRDIKYAKDNFLDYDTNLESSGKSFLAVDDPNAAANSLSLETNSNFQKKIAGGVGINSQYIMSTITKVLRDISVLNENPMKLNSNQMQYYASKAKIEDLSNQNLTSGRSEIKLPNICLAISTNKSCSDPNNPVTVEVMVTPNNIRASALNPNANGLPIPMTSEYVSLNIFVGNQDSETSAKTTGSQNFTVFISRDPSYKIPDFNFSTPDPQIEAPKIIPGTGTVFSGPQEFKQKLVMHTFNLTGKDQSIHFQLKSNFSSVCTQYLVVGRLGQPPILTLSPDGVADATNFSFWGMIPTHTKFCTEEPTSNDPDPFTFFISNNLFIDAKKQVLKDQPDYSKTLDTIYFGVRELTRPEWNLYTSLNRPPVPYTISAQINNTYRIRIYSSGCYSNSNNFQGGWLTAGCVVGPLTTPTKTQCICNHLTSFAGGWIVAPNTINFDYVFSNFDFTKNITLFVTEIVVFLVFILIFIWARRQDNKDIEKVGVTPLPSNDMNDMYLYEITVDTSIRNNSGTNSKVYFILSGEADETDPRHLVDNKRKILQRGSIDRFLLAVPRSLGTLQYIRLWHDNSGKGKNASWYCNYFGVTDLQTKEKFHFLVNNWFAVEENDGQIDRLIAVASSQELEYFQEVFARKMKLNLTEDHLWLSIIARPPESRFTRVERVACCLLLLFLTMLTTCMFYQQEGPSKTSAKLLTVGPFAITPREVWTGFISSIIAFVPLFLIIELFRKSQLKHGHAHKLRQVVEDHLQVSLDASENNAYQSSVATLIRNEESNSARPDTPGYRNTDQINVEIPDYDIENPQDDRNTKEAKKVIRRKFFPWWTRIFVWIFLIIILIVAILFTTLYGIQFGDAACKKWITSMFISFFASVLLTQPIKVILFAIFFALICKKSGSLGDVEYVDEEEELMNELGKRNALLQNEEYLHGNLYTSPIKPHRIVIQPPPREELEKARELRLKELQMFDVLREILFYVVFFCTLLFVTYSFRDPGAFDLKTQLSRIFITPSNPDWQYLGITREDQFWDWALNVLVPGLRAPVWYNNNPQLFQRGFISDRNNRLIGYAILRQVRTKKNSCKVYDYVKPLIKNCYSAYNVFTQEQGDYGPGWTDLLSNQTAPPEFKYTPESNLNGVPYLGRITLYSGGGYVYQFRSNVSNLFNDLTNLRNNRWIDFQTRAIFVEFTTYNPNINLFAINTYVLEFPGSGGIWPIYRVEPANLLGLYSGGVKAFEIFCQILYGIFILVIIVKEIRNIIKLKSKYFTEFWSFCEIFIIFGSFATVAGYVYVTLATNQLTGEFEKYGGDVYLNFAQVAFWNENLGYLISFIVFVATLKFIKVLRFNKRIGMLGAVLSYCGKDLKQFFIIFTIMFLAFVMVFYSLFMDSLYRYHTFLFSIEASLQIALGKFSFLELYQKEPLFGPIVFSGYVLFIIFVLLNMFVAILYEGFSEVKADVDLQGNDHELMKFIMTKFILWTGISNTKIGKKFFKTGMTDQVYKDIDSRNISGKVDEFPEKIEQLLNHINRIMYDDKKGYQSKENPFSSLIFSRSKASLKEIEESHTSSRPGTATSNILKAKADPHMTPLDK